MNHLKLNYIGSKRSLIPLYTPILDKYLKPNAIFGDLFCGTGIVSSFVQSKYPEVEIIANDIQSYATILTLAKLDSYSEEDVEAIEHHLAIMNEETKQGFFSEYYADKYFSRDNCQRIDGMRDYLDRQDLSPKIRNFLLASLISTADSVANTASVYGAYLKKLKPKALQPLQLTYVPVASNQSRIKITIGDAISLDSGTSFDVLYLDPPYNSRQYGSNYHILETIAKYDNPELSGKTLLPPYQKSKFCSKAGSNAFDALKNIVNRYQWKVLILSYSSEGIMRIQDIVKMLLEKGTSRSVFWGV